MGDIDVEAIRARAREGWPTSHDVDDLADEIVRLRSVVTGVEAVADDLEIDAESSAHPRSTTDVTWNAVRRAKRSIARRLRSVLSDTTEGDGHAVD